MTDDGESPRTYAMVSHARDAWHYGDHYRVPLTRRERAELGRHGFVTAARKVPVCTGFVMNQPRGHRSFPQGNRQSERVFSSGKWCTHGCYNRYCCEEHLCRSCRNGLTRPEMQQRGIDYDEGPEWFLTCDAIHTRPWRHKLNTVGDVSDLLAPHGLKLLCISDISYAFIAVPKTIRDGYNGVLDWLGAS